MPPGEMIWSWGRGVRACLKGVAQLIQGERSPLLWRGGRDVVVNNGRYRSVCRTVISALEAIPQLRRRLTGGVFIADHVDGREFPSLHPRH
jgi:hypothetical protein